MTLQEFQNDIRAGIPDRLPAAKPYDKRINHAPKRKDILSDEEKALALKNALRYFPVRHHAVLAKEFAEELRRSWARNEGAVEAIRREMDRTPGLRVTLPVFADEELVREALNEQGGASDKL